MSEKRQATGPAGMIRELESFLNEDLSDDSRQKSAMVGYIFLAHCNFYSSPSVGRTT